MSKKLGIDYQLFKLKRLAPSGHALGLHVRFASAMMMFRTYPQEWLDVYTQEGLMLVDPVVSWGATTQGTCRWSDLNVPDPKQVLTKAKGFGLNYGFAISYGPKESRTIGGFAREDREFTDAEIEEISKVVICLHTATAPPDSLTDAQSEALTLVAKGHRHAEIANNLNISESALKARLKSVRERLLSRTTAEAVQRAIDYELLSI